MKMYLTVSKRASSHSWTGWTVTTYKWRPSKIGRRPPISNLFAWQQVLDPVLGTEGEGLVEWSNLGSALPCPHLQVPSLQCNGFVTCSRRKRTHCRAVRDLWRAECGDYKQWSADLCDTASSVLVDTCILPSLAASFFAPLLSCICTAAV